MKRTLCMIMILAALLCGCASNEAETASSAQPQTPMEQLIAGNEAYRTAANEKTSQERRTDTAENGQHPYAVVVTCSDSRVPAELIFDAGIGELFVIRTAGNVIGSYELGSIEYGVEHLHAPLVVVMGHTNCGAVAAALEGEAHGHIADIVNEISECLPENCEAEHAERLNVENSIAEIRSSHIIQELETEGKVSIIGAIYDIETGNVDFTEFTE